MLKPADRTKLILASVRARHRAKAARSECERQERERTGGEVQR